MSIQEDVGEISVSSDGVHWIVPDICEMVKKKKYRFESSRFRFANKDWWMWLYPYGSSANSVEGYLEIGAVSPNTDIRYRTFQLRIIGEPQGHFVQREAKYLVGKRFQCFSEIPFSYLNYLKDTMLPDGKLHVFLGIEDKKGNTLQGSFMQFTTGDGKENHSESCRAPAELSSLDDIRKLQNDLASLLKGNITDVTVKVRNEEFKCHRCILAARSEVFLAMLTHDTKENSTSVVDIEDVDPTIFKDFLHYLYTGNVKNMTQENVLGLYTISDQYQVVELKNKCRRYIKEMISFENFCDMIALSLQHNEIELMNACVNFFKITCNSLEIIKTSKWQVLMSENPVACNELFIKLLESKKSIENYIIM